MVERAPECVIALREARRAKQKEKAAVTPLPISFVAAGVEVGKEFAAMVLPLKGQVKELYFYVVGENLKRATVEVTIAGSQTVLTSVEGISGRSTKVLEDQEIDAYSLLTAKVSGVTNVTDGQPVVITYAWISGYMKVDKSYLTEIAPSEEEEENEGILPGA